MKVFGLDSGYIILAVQALARGQAIAPVAEVSIAFSALDSCSVITKGTSYFE